MLRVLFRFLAAVVLVSLPGLTVASAQPVPLELYSNLFAGSMVVSVEGDSLSAPFNSSPQGTNTWANYFAPLAQQLGVTNYFNWAGEGEIAIALPRQFAGQAGTVTPTNGEAGWFAVLAGVNDIGRGIDAYIVHTVLSNLWGQARAAGYRVMALTVTPNYGQLAGSYAERWTNLNERIIASSDLWDCLIRPELIVRSASNTVDGLHWDTPSAEAVARIVARALIAEHFKKHPPALALQGEGAEISLTWPQPGFVLETRRLVSPEEPWQEAGLDTIYTNRFRAPLNTDADRLFRLRLP